MNEVFAPKRIVGIATRAPVGDSAPITALWTRFFQQGLPQRLAGGIYCVYSEYDDGDSGAYSVLVGCEVSTEVTLPKGLAEQWIAPGAYHLIDASGELPGSIVEGWRSVRDLPFKRTFRTDFEEYLPDNTQTIYVGVEAGTEADSTPAAERMDSWQVPRS